MLQNYRKQLDSRIVELSLAKEAEKKHKKEVSRLEKEFDTLQEVRTVFKKAAILTQNHLADHLSSIVTKAIRTVFNEKDISFLVEFVERRNTTECDMYFVENDKRFSILDSRGYGMVDIASFALRVAYILLHNNDDVLIIDEPFRNLGAQHQEQASQMIKELSSELNMQVIVCTHVELLKEYADKAFKILQKQGVSEMSLRS